MQTICMNQFAVNLSEHLKAVSWNENIAYGYTNLSSEMLNFILILK